MSPRARSTEATAASARVVTNAFIGKTTPPTERELTAALGAAKAAWNEFLSQLVQQHGATSQEWKCHSVKWGWSMRVKRGQRTIVWLSPRPGRFDVLFILGAKAMSMAQQRKWPKPIIKALAEAKKYPEGTGVRLEVGKAQDIDGLEELAAIKIAN